MKNMTRSIAILLAVFAPSALHAGDSGRGVASVDVIVKQNPSMRTLTSPRGNFSLEPLPAGSYTLTFRARKAKDIANSVSDKALVATAYSIKIDGTKRAVNKSGLTSDDLLAGVDIPVDVGAGAMVRGQVEAGGTKKMVWISKEPGSNVPGRWVEEGSAEAKAAVHHNSHQINVESLRGAGR